MHNYHWYQSSLLRIGSAAMAIIVACATPLDAVASSWNPTLLVNTESFQTIDEGDSTTNLELRFGDTLNEKIIYNRTTRVFEFSRGITVHGTVTATGAVIRGIMSGTTLRVDKNADVWGNLSVSGSTALKGQTTVSNNLIVRGIMSGTTLRVDKNADVWGNLTVSGTTLMRNALTVKGALSGASLFTTGDINANGNITLNNSNKAADAVLTFGNFTGAQTLKFNNATQRFEFSKNLKVNGSISGTALTIDGTVTLRGQSYTFPSNSGSSGQILATDGAGNLSWVTSSVGKGSGSILALQPEYPNAVYFASGSSMVGQLSYAYDATNKENYYHWTSSKEAVQQYWTSVRVRLPSTFSSWDVSAPIQFRYRTGNVSNAVNYVSLRMLDTAGNPVALSNAENLAATSWTTGRTGALTGTFTPGGTITLFVKTATTSSGSADISSIVLLWQTSVP